MREPGPARGSQRGVWLAVAVGLTVRVVAAVAVWVVTTRRGELCLFDDTAIYWDLAGRLVEGRPYVVSQYGIPHFALRAPGYPLFLAGCRWVFGTSTLGPRLIQAGLGAASVLLVAALARRLEPDENRHGSSATGAAWVAAVEPYSVAMSALLLSEAMFVPLMLVTLVGLARLWKGEVGSIWGDGGGGNGTGGGRGDSEPAVVGVVRAGGAGRVGAGSGFGSQTGAGASEPGGPGRGGGDESVVGAERAGAGPVRADGPVDGGEPL